MFKAILLSVVLAKPAIRTVRNPNAASTRILKDGERPEKVIFNFNKELSDELFDKHWFKDCMSQVKIMENLVVEVGELDGRCSLTDILAEMRSDPDVASADEDQRVKALGIPSDPYWNDLWGFAKAEVEGAWQTYTGSDNE